MNNNKFNAYLVVYQNQECYSINKAFINKVKAEKYCEEVNKKELEKWDNLADIHHVVELEVEDE